MIRILCLVGGLAVGAICVLMAPETAHSLRDTVAVLPGFSWLVPSVENGHTHADIHRTNSRSNGDHDHAHGHDHGHDHQEHTDDSNINLTDEQIEAAGILTAEAGEGFLVRRLQVPGAIIPSADRVARVAVKVVGTIAELRKRLGDVVTQGEVVAVIESREVADAKSDYLAARVTHDLQQILTTRAKTLSDSKSMPENDYLRTRGQFDDARVRRDAARQKLFAIGLSEQEIVLLPQLPIDALHRQELRAPISGRIAERRVDLGALVGREGLESEIYVIVDPAEVWAELAVAPADLHLIRDAQDVEISTPSVPQRTQGKIIFVSPLLDRETRSARVVISLANPHGQWRPGSFITAHIPLERQRADIVVPKTAVQTIAGQPVVFVRRRGGFSKRPITAGRDDDRSIEVTSGLKGGERVATANTFVLKAELGKAAAGDHDH